MFDWVIPKEWKIRDAYVENGDGERVISYQDNNLHVLGYSAPVDCYVEYDELINHMYSEPNQPDVIPYVTSYYEERWGFCVSENQKK